MSFSSQLIIKSRKPSKARATARISASYAPARTKETLYVSNIDYNLTNSDLHTIFSTFGKLAKVTVLKDRATRQSKGVAFVLFVRREDAARAAKEMDGKILNGRTLRASIAGDNGRATEFIKKKVYKDKSRCYECGEEGHLSYECPRNFLGPRELPPPPKKGRRGGSSGGESRGRDFEGEAAGGNWGELKSGIGFGVFTPNPPSFPNSHKGPHFMQTTPPSSEILRKPPLDCSELQKLPHVMRITP
ncbi:U11/U12 small nuclear ribonucleoprotein 31 kDa protein-like [Salvia miltiorrhiza]|uniref:U11/U12 small nuclear ribonucleoprotein 31 kDa protein-like n=1 Tax=Salvia miltiorrhiza TaxID=226208 RepID=UPI0025AD5740|nr:U11/U12 small nuclear ribonucleoprotein 31 kDa protein-like [Salvia miltiorrhiza]